MAAPAPKAAAAPPARVGTGPGWPPAEMTPEEATAAEPLTPQFKDLLRLRGVHYATWGELADSGILDIVDFAALFATEAECSADCDTALNFALTDDAGDWPRRKHLLNKVKVQQAFQDAKAREATVRKLRNAATDNASGFRAILNAFDRSNLERLYQDKWGNCPNLEGENLQRHVPRQTQSPRGKRTCSPPG